MICLPWSCVCNGGGVVGIRLRRASLLLSCEALRRLEHGDRSIDGDVGGSGGGVSPVINRPSNFVVMRREFGKHDAQERACIEHGVRVQNTIRLVDGRDPFHLGKEYLATSKEGCYGLSRNVGEVVQLQH